MKSLRRAGVRALWGAALLTTAFALCAVEVNQASQAELEMLRGIGPEISSRIIEQRERRPFSDWNDLGKRIRGLGNHTARRLSEAGLTVAGRRFDAPAAATAPGDAPASSVGK